MGGLKTEPVQWEQWFTDMMNNRENTAGSSTNWAKTDVGPTPLQAFAASSTATNQMGFQHGNLRAYNIGGSDIGLPHGSIHIDSSRVGNGNNIGPGQPDANIDVGGNNSGKDSNLGLPQENTGAGGMTWGCLFFSGSIDRSDVALQCYKTMA